MTIPNKGTDLIQGTSTNESTSTTETTSTMTVAIKVMKPNVSMEAESDFRREIEILASFDHQNIVKLLGICIMNSGNCPLSYSTEFILRQTKFLHHDANSLFNLLIIIFPVLFFIIHSLNPFHC